MIALRDPARIVQGLARVAAVADHIETPVPFGRQTHFEGDLRRQQPCHAAVRGHNRGGGNLGGVDLRNVLRFKLPHRLARLTRRYIRLGIIDKPVFQICECLGPGRCDVYGRQKDRARDQTHGARESKTGALHIFLLAIFHSERSVPRRLTGRSLSHPALDRPSHPISVTPIPGRDSHGRVLDLL